MKRLLAFVLMVTLLSSLCFAEEDISKVSLPSEVKQEMRVDDKDKEIQGKQWNRWTSGKFVVCSLNDTQAKFLHENLDKVRAWTLTRWGLPDTPLASECRLICVDDKAFFKKLFNLEQTKVEIRRKTGKIEMSVIFMLLDDRPARTIPSPLTEICISEYEQQNNVKFGWWAHRGMCLLNGSLPDIRKNLSDLHTLVKADTALYMGKGLLTMTEEQYAQANAADKEKYDKCAVALCLLLRKEFGQDKFLKMIVEPGDPEAALKKIYGFDNYGQFDASFKRYMVDLTSDIVGARPKRPVTPDSYLQIKPKKK